MENHQDKASSGGFQVTTLENPLLSITSGYKYKKFYQTLWHILKYQPTVEPFPQIHNWTCIVVAIFQFNARILVRDQSMMHELKYVTNTSNLKKILAVKFFNSLTMKIKKLFGYKTLGRKDAVVFSERIIN